MTNINSIKNFIKLNDIDNVINESIQDKIKLNILFDIYDKTNHKEEKDIIYISSSLSDTIPRLDNNTYINNINNDINNLCLIGNDELIKNNSYKFLYEPNLNNNSIIGIRKSNEKNPVINVIFNYKGKSFSLTANINDSFKNIVLILSNEIGVKIDLLDFYNNNVKLDKNSYNKNFRELGLNNSCSFNVFQNLKAIF